MTVKNIMFCFVTLCLQVGWVAVGSGRLLRALSRPADRGCRGTARPTRRRCLFRRRADGKPKETSLRHHCQVLQWTRKSSTSLRTPPRYTCGNSEFTGWDWISLTVILWFMFVASWKLWTEIWQPILAHFTTFFPGQVSTFCHPMKILILFHPLSLSHLVSF